MSIRVILPGVSSLSCQWNVYYAISTGSNTIGCFVILLIISASNDTIITITPTVNIIIPTDLTPTDIGIMITSGNSVTIQLDYLQTF